MDLKKNKYTFSIIIPTINRKIEVQQLLESICKINYEKISEIIIIDQNKENFLEEIVNKFKKIVPIVHKRVNFKGAAKARNYGAEYANGDILVFPDDDSTILENTLTIVNDKFNEYFNIVAVFGKVSDYNEKVDIINYLNKKTYVKFSNLYRTCIECSFFIKKEIFYNIGKFDENLGVGTYYGSEEGADIFCRLLYQKEKMLYIPETFFYHPNKKREENMDKYYSYGLGTGKFAKKHLKEYKKVIPFIYWILKNVKSILLIIGAEIKKDNYIVERNISLIKGRRNGLK